MKTLLKKFGIMFVFFGVIAIFVFPIINKIYHIIQLNDQQLVIEYLSSFSIQGMFVIWFIQFMAIFFMFIPAMPIQMLAGALYNPLMSYLICISAFVLGNVGFMLLIRTFYDRMPNSIKNPKNKFVQKIDNTKNPVVLLFFATLIPGFPNGLLAAFASRTKINATGMFVAVLLGMTPSCIVFNAIGRNVVYGNYQIIVYIGIFLVILGVLFFIFKKQINEWIDRY